MRSPIRKGRQTTKLQGMPRAERGIGDENGTIWRSGEIGRPWRGALLSQPVMRVSSFMRYGPEAKRLQSAAQGYLAAVTFWRIWRALTRKETSFAEIEGGMGLDGITKQSDRWAPCGLELCPISVRIGKLFSLHYR